MAWTSDDDACPSDIGHTWKHYNPNWNKRGGGGWQNIGINSEQGIKVNCDDGCGKITD